MNAPRLCLRGFFFGFFRLRAERVEQAETFAADQFFQAFAVELGQAGNILAFAEQLPRAFGDIWLVEDMGRHGGLQRNKTGAHSGSFLWTGQLRKTIAAMMRNR